MLNENQIIRLARLANEINLSPEEAAVLAPVVDKAAKEMGFTHDVMVTKCFMIDPVGEYIAEVCCKAIAM